ncbi:MAG: MFS transporter [Acidobacteriia bacterium]|nr:MFS transporter [Terriglobia bacterium]
MLTKRERWVLALLVVSAFINYIDRATLSVGAVAIQAELGVSNYQLGVLQSAFFWTYAAFQLFAIAGLLVDRFHVGWIYAAGFFIWSGATAGTGISRSFAALFAMRLLLGLGESVAYPAYSRILASFPEQRRGFANAAIDAGTRSGPALGVLLGGLLMAQYGWRAFFLALGLGSMLWLIAWVLWMPRDWSAAAAKKDTGDAPGVGDILRQRSAWFTFLGLFCGNYFWYFLLTWLPAYLQKERHFAARKMAVWGALAFLSAAVSTVICGWLADRWIARGATPTRARKTFTGGGLALATIIVPVAVIRSDTGAMALLLAACAFIGMWSSNMWAITQTIAGPRAAGKWCAIQNGVGNLAGVSAPWITGWVVERTGQFYLAFVTAAVVALAGAAIFIFGVGPVQRVDWRAGGMPWLQNFSSSDL